MREMCEVFAASHDEQTTMTVTVDNNYCCHSSRNAQINCKMSNQITRTDTVTGVIMQRFTP